MNNEDNRTGDPSGDRREDETMIDPRLRKAAEGGLPGAGKPGEDDPTVVNPWLKNAFAADPGGDGDATMVDPRLLKAAGAAPQAAGTAGEDAETVVNPWLKSAAAAGRGGNEPPPQKTGGKPAKAKGDGNLDLEIIDLSLEDVTLDDIWIEDDTGKVSRDFKEVTSALNEIEEAKKRRLEELAGSVTYHRAEDFPDEDEDDEPDEERKTRRQYAVLKLLAAATSVIIALAGITVGYLYIHPLMFPRPEPVFDNIRELQVAGNSVHFRAGTERLQIPLPEGYQVLDPHSYFRMFPLAEKVARYEKCEIIFAAKSAQDGKGFFINLALDDESRDIWYSERQFRNLMHKTVNARKIAGALRIGQHRIIEPFEVMQRSACYGRIMTESSSFGATRFGQYSCMLYFGDRVLILNAGFAAPGRTLSEEDIEQCRSILLKWRNLLLGEPTPEVKRPVRASPLRDFKAPTRPLLR